jgi:hypothetical protein
LRDELTSTEDDVDGDRRDLKRVGDRRCFCREASVRGPRLQGRPLTPCWVERLGVEPVVGDIFGYLVRTVVRLVLGFGFRGLVLRFRLWVVRRS